MYLKNKRIFILSVVLLTLSRLALKIFNIDMIFGFYSQPPLLPFVDSILNLLALIGLGLFYFKTKDEGITVFECTSKIRYCGIYYGIVIIIATILNFIKLINISHLSVNSLPKPILFIEYLLGILSGIILLLDWHKNIDSKLILFVPFYTSIYSIERFISFKQVTTVPDQLLETFYLVFTILFWMEYVKFNEVEKRSRKNAIFAACGSILFGLPLLIAQLICIVVFSKVSGPSLNSLMIISANIIYEFSAIKGLIYSQKKL